MPHLSKSNDKGDITRFKRYDLIMELMTGMNTFTQVYCPIFKSGLNCVANVNNDGYIGLTHTGVITKWKAYMVFTVG